MKKFLRGIKWTGIVLLALVVVLAVVVASLPKGPRDLMVYEDKSSVEKTILKADSYAVVAGTPWASEAAMEMLNKGGNAYDAAVAGLLVLNVTNGIHSSFPCVVPTMIYDASTGDVRSYIGTGTAPQAATLDKFTAKGWKTMPSINMWSQLVPASPDVMIALLREYGTFSFADVAAPAIKIAQEGFPATRPLLMDMGDFNIFMRAGYAVMFPYNAKVWFQNKWWRPLVLHDRLRFPDLASTFQQMVDAEQRAIQAGGTRDDGLQAVRDLFYKGAIADEIVAFEVKKKGLITSHDLAEYTGGWEEPISGSYGEYTFYTNQGWTQGVVSPLALQILEGIDLKSMGHNSTQYIHTVVQAIELAQADRDAYVGDPAFIDVPWEVLLSKGYAAERRSMMTDNSFGALPPAGVLSITQTGSLPIGQHRSLLVVKAENRMNLTIGQDTTQLAVVDRWGNAVVMTPSDFPWTPMVPGTGMNLGNRMNQFRLDPEDVDALQPGKRPRITPHAVIVFKHGKFFMAYSTPGGDMQPQALIQVFLNMAVFGMDIQEAVSAPRFYSITAPSSFAPHEANPGTIRLEQDIYQQVTAGLQALGYKTIADTKWNFDFGSVGAVLLGEDGKLYAGADPRWETWALGK